MRRVIWRHTDGRRIVVMELLKIGYFPPGYTGSSYRALAPSGPTGTTMAVMERSLVSSLTDAEWFGQPFGEGWTMDVTL